MLDKIYEKYIKTFFKDKNNIVILVTAFVIGIINYYSFLINEVTVPDAIDAGNIYNSGMHEISLGRWSIPLLDNIRNGLVAEVPILFAFTLSVALFCIFIVNILKIKNKIIICFTTVLVILFPACQDTLIFTYTIDHYGLAIFIATLSAFFFTKYDKNKKNMYITNKIIAAILMILSLSIYQAYIGITISICVFVSILRLINKDKLSIVFKDLAVNALTCVISIFVYYLISNLVIDVYNQQFNTYRNANDVKIENLSTYLEYIKYSYNNFVDFMFKDRFIINTVYYRNIANIIFVIITLICFILCIIKNKIHKDLIRLLFIILLICMLPITLNIINIIVPATNIHILMIMPYILIYIFCFKFIDICDFKSKNIIYILALVSCVYICITYILLSKRSYELKQKIYESYYDRMLKVLCEIEQIEDYKYGQKILFVGSFRYELDAEDRPYYNYDSFATFNVVWENFFGYTLLDSFCFRYMGYIFNVCSSEEYEKILQSEEYNKMQVYPEYNSIKMIDDIIVVKLEDLKE